MPHIKSAFDRDPELAPVVAKLGEQHRMQRTAQRNPGHSGTPIGDRNVAAWQQGEAPGFTFSGQPGYGRIVTLNKERMAQQNAPPPAPTPQEIAERKRQADTQLAAATQQRHHSGQLPPPRGWQTVDRSKVFRESPDLPVQGADVAAKREMIAQQPASERQHSEADRKIRERRIREWSPGKHRDRMVEAYQRDYGQAPATPQQEARQQRLEQFEGENRARMHQPRRQGPDFKPVVPVGYLDNERQTFEQSMRDIEEQLPDAELIYDAATGDNKAMRQAEQRELHVPSADIARKTVHALRAKRGDIKAELDALQRRQGLVDDLTRAIPQDLIAHANRSGQPQPAPDGVRQIIEARAGQFYRGRTKDDAVNVWLRALGYQPDDEQRQAGDGNSGDLPVARSYEEAQKYLEQGKPFVAVHPETGERREYR